LFAVVLLVVLCASCGGDDSDDGGSVDGDVDNVQEDGDVEQGESAELSEVNPDQFDLTGDFALKIKSEQMFSTLLGDAPVTIATYSYIRFEQDGLTLSEKRKVCDVVLSKYAEGTLTEYPKAAVDGYRLVESDITLDTDMGGAKYQNEYYRLLGYETEDPANDSVPEDKDDKRLKDHDKDGNPGVTIQLSGNALTEGWVYIASFSHYVMEGIVIDSDRIESTSVDADHLQNVLDAETMAAKAGATSAHDPDKPSSFVMVRMPDGSDCQTVLDNAGEWFDEEE